MYVSRSHAAFAVLVVCLSFAGKLPAADTANHRNVVLILSDDHRYDFLGFHPESPEFLETPHLDRMAAEGAHFANAFVSTSLCSPSRASILSGQYMHHHRVVDNQRPVPPGTQFFPQMLQTAGYKTGFVGKWHMGHADDTPRDGFDHWVSFPGQGVYHDPTLNINGKRQQFEGYTTDVLTDQATAWLGAPNRSEEPFFLMLSYKAVHYPFEPAPRHLGRYEDEPIDYPETMANTERNYRSQPHWVRERRYSIHGIDHMETGPFDKDPVPNFDDLYHRYCESVHGLDENIGRVLQSLEQQQLDQNTLVIYLGDNGFYLGEHGFYDKRDAYEESIRIPLIAWAPSQLSAGRTIPQMVQNIDLAPTILEWCDASPADNWTPDGQSFVPLLNGDAVPWRDHVLYEYHWEWNFPATPTTFAIRTQRYKYMFHHGVWDANGLFDLQTDPLERHNLIHLPAYRELADQLRDQLFTELEASGGLVLPVRPPAGERLDQRKLRR